MLGICHKTDKDGGNWIANCCERIFYVHAPIRSMRQKVQQGRYILFPNHIKGDTDEEKCFGWTIDAIPKSHKDIVGQILIPKEIKQKMLQDLAILGIKTDVLFGDNIDIVCKGIVERFAIKYKH